MSTNQDAQAIRLLQHRCAQLEDCVDLVLLFHRGGPWLDSDRLRWQRITGNDDATTKAMCDHLRKRMATTEVPS